LTQFVVCAAASCWTADGASATASVAFKTGDVSLIRVGSAVSDADGLPRAGRLADLFAVPARKPVVLRLDDFLAVVLLDFAGRTFDFVFLPRFVAGMQQVLDAACFYPFWFFPAS
jgi:hypothetical protein